jgi:nucleoid DNA-binding protein
MSISTGDRHHIPPRFASLSPMRRKDLARALAVEAKIPGALAQDRVDAVVHDILRRLKAGKAVKLSGVGKLLMPRTGPSQ